MVAKLNAFVMHLICFGQNLNLRYWKEDFSNNFLIYATQKLQNNGLSGSTVGRRSCVVPPRAAALERFQL